MTTTSYAELLGMIKADTRLAQFVKPFNTLVLS